MEGKKTIFQRNNAPLHKAVSTKKRIQDFWIELLPYPALNCKLITLEKLWRSFLAKKIYDQERPLIENTYNKKKYQFKERIKSAWANIQNETLNKFKG